MSFCDFLAPHLSILKDVMNDIRGLSNEDAFAQFKLHPYIARFPDQIEITDRDLLADIAEVLRVFQKPGDPERRHRGEVATAVYAQSVSATVLMDDRDGQKLAGVRNVEVFTTEDLCVEMVRRGKLDRETGERIFRRVYNSDGAKFERHLEAPSAAWFSRNPR